MAVGVLLSMVSFVVVYAKLPALTSSTLQLRSSSVVRSYEERCTLLCRANRGKIVTISLKGYVFFGSAVKILEEVKSRVILTPAAADDITSLTSKSKAQAQAQSQSQQKSHHGNFNFNLDQSDEGYGKGANMSEERYGNRDIGRGRDRGIYNGNHMETDIEADVDLDLVAPAPMFSFQMSSVTSKDKIDDKSATGDKKSRGQGQRQGSTTALLLPSSIIPLVFGWKDDSHSDSRSDGSYVGGASPHYISSRSNMSNSSYCEEGDEGSWIDEEGCATPHEKSSSEKRGGRKDSHAYEGTAAPDPERERESAAGKGRKLSGYSGILLKESTEGTERVDSLVMGSPLQSLSAYDMNEDMLRSYQKRWMQERTQHCIPIPHAIQTISPSVSTHSLSQSRSQSQSRQETPSSRPPPHPHPDWTAAIKTPESFVKMKQKLKASTAIEMEVEDEMSITADQPSCSPSGKGVPDTYRDLLPYPRCIATLSASIAAPLDARKQSALSFRIAQLGGIVGIADKRYVEKEVTDGGGGGAAAPLISNSRTKSMSNLNYAVCNFSDSSSSSSSSILGAVWSNQERRRERVKLLSRSRSTPTATERGTDRETERDWEKRSKSYDSLSVAVSRHVGGPHSNNALPSIERNISSWASSAPSTSESLPPDRTRGTDKGTGTGQGTEMEPTEFLILDFTEVLGIDATSARSCFLMLVSESDNQRVD